MSENCGRCKDGSPETIPYIVHEIAMAKAERCEKRLFAVIILLIVLLVGTNMAWIYYESQFEVVETTEVVQENTDGYNNYIGNDGDINNGETDNQEN